MDNTKWIAFFLSCLISSQKLETALANTNSSDTLCNFTIAEVACHLVRFSCPHWDLDFENVQGTTSQWLFPNCISGVYVHSKNVSNLTPNNLVTLLNCSLERNKPAPVAVWKLLFQKASPVLDQALESFSTMVDPCHTQAQFFHSVLLCIFWW